jgi:hypothetical protein
MRVRAMLDRSEVTGGDRAPLLRRRWAALGTLVVAIGSLAAVFGATVTATRTASTSLRELATSASQIATNLQLALQHEDDLVVSAAAYFLDSQTR